MKFVQKKLFSEKEIQEKISLLADRINIDYKDKENIVLVVVLKGAFLFASDLAKRLSFSLEIEFVRVKTYSGIKTMKKPDSLYCEKDLTEFKGKHLIVVEDIIDKGETAKFILNSFERVKPASLRLCSLCYKESAFEKIDSLDYSCFLVKENQFLIGYGLDYDEKYRNLPRIDYLVKKVIQ